VNKRKKHIDDVFKDGLKNLRQMVSDKDFDAIDKKSSKFKDDSTVNSQNLFNDFELPITEQDWLSTKSKLDNEKLNIQNDVPELSQLSELEIQPNPNDWPITYRKYKTEKRKRIFFFWFNRAGILLGLLIAGLFVWFNSVESESESSVVQTNTNQTSLSPTAIPSQNNTRPEIDNTIAHSETNPQNPSEISKSANSTPSNSGLHGNHLKHTMTPSNILEKPIQKLEASTNSEIEPQNVNLTTEKPIHENIGLTQVTNEVLNKTAETDITALTLLELTENLNNNFLNMLLYAMRNYPDDFNLPELQKHAFHKPIINPKTFRLNVAMVNKVDYSYRRLNSENPIVYNNIKNNSDKAQYRYSGGFEVSLPSKRMLYSAGLNYTTYNFKSDYNYKYRVFDSIPVYDQTGTIVIGHFLTRGRDTSINETQNIKISQIQMPLSLSYRFYNQKRWSIYGGLGTVLSMNTKQSGLKMINPINNQLYYYQRLENMERKFNVAPMLMGDVQYYLRNNWSVSAGFSGSMNLKSRFNNSFGAKEFLYSYGLQFKIIKQLTWYK
jgi:hypothetical protein